MPTTPPDFEALRAERNREHAEWVRSMEAEGFTVRSHCSRRSDDACFCTCGLTGENGGLCEHKWDGEPYTSDDGLMISATCSRCGMSAYSHDLRTMP